MQLARLAALSQRGTVVTDAGRPLAAIAIGSVSDGAAVSGLSAAGWLRRIETYVRDLARQHAVMVSALEVAWRELDGVSPPGVDSHMDVSRLAHADLRRPR